MIFWLHYIHRNCKICDFFEMSSFYMVHGYARIHIGLLCIKNLDQLKHMSERMMQRRNIVHVYVNVYEQLFFIFSTENFLQ